MLESKPYIQASLISAVLQGIGARVRRETLRQTWVPTGEKLRDLEKRGIYIRFVVGYRWSNLLDLASFCLYTRSSDCMLTGFSGSLP